MMLYTALIAVVAARDMAVPTIKLPTIFGKTVCADDEVCCKKGPRGLFAKGQTLKCVKATDDDADEDSVCKQWAGDLPQSQAGRAKLAKTCNSQNHKADATVCQPDEVCCESGTAPSLAYKCAKDDTSADPDQVCSQQNPAGRAKPNMLCKDASAASQTLAPTPAPTQTPAPTPAPTPKPTREHPMTSMPTPAPTPVPTIHPMTSMPTPAPTFPAEHPDDPDAYPVPPADTGHGPLFTIFVLALFGGGGYLAYVRFVNQPAARAPQWGVEMRDPQ